jgi:hypothetical protein
MIKFWGNSPLFQRSNRKTRFTVFWVAVGSVDFCAGRRLWLFTSGVLLGVPTRRIEIVGLF